VNGKFSLICREAKLLNKSKPTSIYFLLELGEWEIESGKECGKGRKKKVTVVESTVAKRLFVREFSLSLTTPVSYPCLPTFILPLRNSFPFHKLFVIAVSYNLGSLFPLHSFPVAIFVNSSVGFRGIFERRFHVRYSAFLLSFYRRLGNEGERCS